METEKTGQVVEQSQAAPQTAATAPVAEKPVEAPKLFAGKYKTPEELEKGYKALEAKLGTKASEPAKTAVETPEAPAAKAPTEKAAQEALNTPIGQELLAEFQQTGAISDAMVEKASKATGFPKEYILAVKDTMVSKHQAGLKNIADSLKDDGVSVENISSFIGHLDKTLNEGQKAAVQTMIEMGNFDALRPMAKAWSKTQLPAGETGKTVNTSGGFANREDFFKAVKSMTRDNQQSVYARIEATPKNLIDGWNRGEK